MLSSKTTRRDFLKKTAAVPGGAVLASSASWALAAAPEAKQQAQIDYLANVLKKFTLTATTVTEKDILAFASDYTKQHGLVHYRAEFGGVAGEAKLVRLFVQRRHPGVMSAAVTPKA